MAKYAQKSKGMIRTKYVIIPGINDKLSEAKNFIQKTYDAGIKNIAVDIEDNWYKEHRNSIPQHIYTLYDFFVEGHKHYNIDSCEIYERAYNLKVDREHQQNQ